MFDLFGMHRLRGVLRALLGLLVCAGVQAAPRGDDPVAHFRLGDQVMAKYMMWAKIPPGIPPKTPGG